MPNIVKGKKEKKEKETKVVAEKKPILEVSDKKGKATKKEEKNIKTIRATNKKENSKNNVTKKILKNENPKETKKKVTNTKKQKVEKEVVNVTLIKKEKSVKKEPKQYLQEYYDLPYRYNETVVKILAQTPKRLFVYWEISDKDRERYVKAFGEDFFEKTYPVLLIHNEEMNYTFEVPINDFANSWYLDIKDPKTKYVVQLGRKFRNVEETKINTELVAEEKINLQNDFVYITDSNKLEAPNDRVLFENIKEQVTYRNIKNGYQFNKEFKDIVSKLEKTCEEPDIKEMYKELYGDEFDREEEFDISNPGSGTMPTSSFKI